MADFLFTDEQKLAAQRAVDDLAARYGCNVSAHVLMRTQASDKAAGNVKFAMASGCEVNGDTDHVVMLVKALEGLRTELVVRLAELLSLSVEDIEAFLHDLPDLDDIA